MALELSVKESDRRIVGMIEQWNVAGRENWICFVDFWDIRYQEKWLQMESNHLAQVNGSWWTTVVLCSSTSCHPLFQKI
jgi:hypothetical protein